MQTAMNKISELFTVFSQGEKGIFFPGNRKKLSYLQFALNQFPKTLLLNSNLSKKMSWTFLFYVA